MDLTKKLWKKTNSSFIKASYCDFRLGELKKKPPQMCTPGKLYYLSLLIGQVCDYMQREAFWVDTFFFLDYFNLSEDVNA